MTRAWSGHRGASPTLRPAAAHPLPCAPFTPCPPCPGSCILQVIEFITKFATITTVITGAHGIVFNHARAASRRLALQSATAWSPVRGHAQAMRVPWTAMHTSLLTLFPSPPICRTGQPFWTSTKQTMKIFGAPPYHASSLPVLSPAAPLR